MQCAQCASMAWQSVRLCLCIELLPCASCKIEAFVGHVLRSTLRFASFDVFVGHLYEYHFNCASNILFLSILPFICIATWSNRIESNRIRNSLNSQQTVLKNNSTFYWQFVVEDIEPIGILSVRAKYQKWNVWTLSRSKSIERSCSVFSFFFFFLL